MDIKKFAFDREASSFLSLSPEDCIRLMYDSTDENGILYVTEEFDTGVEPYDINFEEFGFKCQMDWTDADRDAVIFMYERLRSAFNEITKNYAEGGTSVTEMIPENAENKDLLAKYLQDPEGEDAGKSFDIPVEAVHLISLARRLCRLMELGAPDIIINNEARDFAVALALNMHCKNKEDESIERPVSVEEKVVRSIFGLQSGEDVIINDDVKELVKKNIEELDPEDAKMLQAFYAEDLSEEEFAAAYNIPKSDVTHSIARALRMLRNPKRSKAIYEIAVKPLKGEKPQD